MRYIASLRDLLRAVFSASIGGFEEKKKSRM